MTDYIRLRLHGTLTTQSPLHIGTGELEDSTDTAGDDRPQKLPVALIELDCEGKPFIPASALRGVLRAQAVRRDLPGIDTLFGNARVDSDNPEKASSGQLRIYPARISQPDGVTCDDYPRLKIDPVTATAADHHLFSSRLVPPGTEFAFRIELDPVGRQSVPAQSLAAVNALLETLSDDEQLLLGKGGSYGQGHMCWQQDHFEGISRAEFSSWLVSDQPELPDHIWQPVNCDLQLPLTAPEQVHIKLSFALQSPLLINGNSKKTQMGDKDPVAVARLRDNRALIPGSSLKGMLRGQCRKILYTICAPQCNEDPHLEAMLNQLFGCTEYRGQLQLTDALGDSEAQVHCQFFNAIDRFTGGVKDGALYHVEALAHANDSARLYATLSLPRQWLQQNHWAQALLLMLLRDAVEGDLRAGWGKAKGYGQLRCEVQYSDTGSKIDNWQALQHGWLALMESQSTSASLFAALKVQLTESPTQGLQET